MISDSKKNFLDIVKKQFFLAGRFYFRHFFQFGKKILLQEKMLWEGKKIFHYRNIFLASEIISVGL